MSDQFSSVRLALVEDIERALSKAVPAPGAPVPERVAESMRHSLLSPGKRVRGLITLLAAGEAHQGAAMPGAVAVEMVHAASLILDDLPSMDDAEMRRGKPTNHRVFGESTAILAAIALMNDAFGVLSAADVLDERARCRSIDRLSAAIGCAGLVGGQEEDLQGVPDPSSADDVALMQVRKTGALFAVSATLGAVAAGVDDEAALSHLDRYGNDLGLAFQIWDDLLDRLASPELAGKDTGIDTGKVTLVGLLGTEGAFAEAERLRQSARDALAIYSDQTGRNVDAVSAFSDEMSDVLTGRLRQTA